MKIVRSQRYTNALQVILRFIAIDSKNRALEFKKELDTHINDLDHMPYKFRQSYYFDDEHMRDLIFKGYTIVYKVDEEKECITIVGIKNTNKGF